MGCNDYYRESKWETAARDFMKENSHKDGEEFIFALAREFEKRDKKQLDHLVERARKWFVKDFYDIQDVGLVPEINKENK